jgi:hypothetical protein
MIRTTAADYQALSLAINLKSGMKWFEKCPVRCTLTPTIVGVFTFHKL